MYHEATPRTRHIVSRDEAKALPGQRTPKEIQQAYLQCGGLAPLWPEARMRSPDVSRSYPKDASHCVARRGQSAAGPAHSKKDSASLFAVRRPGAALA